jgi:hypothetical protein
MSWPPAVDDVRSLQALDECPMRGVEVEAVGRSLELTWSAPLTASAPRFNISDVTLLLGPTLFGLQPCIFATFANREQLAHTIRPRN